jgi:hypothetical protein
MINFFLGLLDLTNRRKVNKIINGGFAVSILMVQNCRILAVIIQIQKNNLNRLLFLKASAFSSSSKSSPSSDSTTQTITSRHLLLFVFEIIFFSPLFIPNIRLTSFYY